MASLRIGAMNPPKSADSQRSVRIQFPAAQFFRIWLTTVTSLCHRCNLRSHPPQKLTSSTSVETGRQYSLDSAQHDNDIFRRIDDHLPDLSDASHLFLLAYRAVLREFHVCLQNAWRFQSTYQKRIEFGLSPGTEPCDFGMFATDHLCNAYECYEYKRRLDQYFLATDWPQLKHHIIVLKDQPPSIAASSMFSLDDVDAPDTPRVTLSVFPAGPDVVVVFSAVPNDAPFVTTYLDRILTSDGHFQKYLLSKLILQSCDNFVVSPRYFDSLTQDRKDAICQFCVDTILENSEEHEDAGLYLF